MNQYQVSLASRSLTLSSELSKENIDQDFMKSVCLYCTFFISYGGLIIMERFSIVETHNASKFILLVFPFRFINTQSAGNAVKLCFWIL